jgi:hypothetical protein
VRQEAHPTAHIFAVVPRIEAEDLGLSLGGPGCRGKDAEQGGLSGAIGPQETDRLSWGDLNGKSRQRPVTAGPFPEPPGDDCR